MTNPESRKQKLKIAITGGIGSGKSAFCKFLTDAGYPVINADEVSKNILATDKSIRQKVINEFGQKSFIGDKINKQYIAQKVFSNSENVRKINSILHPVVIKKIEELMQEELKKSELVFAEAALIYEAKTENMFDYIALITSNKKNRLERKVNEGFTKEDFEEREKNQMNDEDKVKRADFIFENNSGLKELEKKTGLLITILKGLITT